MEIVKNILYFIFLFIGIVYVLAHILCYYIYPIINFFIKTFTKIKNYIKNPPPSPRKRCAELEAECKRLTKELSESKRKQRSVAYRNHQNVEFLKAEHNREIGQIVKEEFDNIVLSFISSKPLVPNVSVEHLTRLCNVSEANDRFFRALLQDFEIEKLKIVKDKNGKHNIAMKLKSGENTYITTLTTCTCQDFYRRNGQKVCKHMYFLALTLGLISSEHYDNFYKSALFFPDKKKVDSLKGSK